MAEPSYSTSQADRAMSMYGTAKAPRMRHDYIDNTEFRNRLVEYKAKVMQARAEGKQDPQVTPYLAKMLLLIAQNTSRRSNFAAYPFREEMVGDAVEVCLKKILNYDVTKSANAFGYFSLITWRVFLNRIAIEKRALYIKLKMKVKAMANHETYDGEDRSLLFDEEGMEYAYKFIKDFEDKHYAKPADDVDIDVDGDIANLDAGDNMTDTETDGVTLDAFIVMGTPE